jgi:hypothetical protein
MGVVLVVPAALVGGAVAVAHVDLAVGLLAGVVGLVVGLLVTTIASQWLSRGVTVGEEQPSVLQEAVGCAFLFVVVVLGPAAALAASLAFLLL